MAENTMNQFETAVGTVAWEADAQGLKITFRKRTRQLRWADITAAGLVQFSDANPSPNMPTDILPGLEKLFDLNRWLAREQRQLVLARGRSSFRAVRIPIPVQRPEARVLVEQVRQRLNEKWIGEVPIQDHQSAMGLTTPWWFYLLFAVGFVAFGLTLLLAMGTFDALSSGQVVGVPLLAWLALLFWVVLAAVILWLYRRRG
jgi:hypothetical protein